MTTTTQAPTSTFDLAERLNSGESYQAWIHRLSHPERTPDRSECIGVRPDGTIGRQPWSEERHIFNPLRLPHADLLNGPKAATAYLRAAFVELIENRADTETRDRAMDYLARAVYIVGALEDTCLDLLTIHRDNAPPLLMFGTIEDLDTIRATLRKAGEL